jgi:uncharacterized membrane protein YhaH (DUF805 family)
MFEKHLAYLRDNPQGYWFKRKLYGWGWTPVKWQGWLVILAYVVILLGIILPLGEKSEADPNLLYAVFEVMLILTAALIGICFWKGESPRWQWGLPKKDK